MQGFKHIQAIITDIEGTTTKISFVHDVLFPYAAQRLPKFVRNNESSLIAILAEARSIIARETGISENDISTAQVIETMLNWIAQDRKITPLKTLQGMIWVEGYQTGDFTGHLYGDVEPQLARWYQAGIQLYVYSSGSVAAQKLLFGYSDAGDIRHLLKGHFDTQLGGKKESQSYLNIAHKCAMSVESCLFLSDVEEELDAAQAAGMNTCCLVREAHSGQSKHLKAETFTQVAEFIHD